MTNSFWKTSVNGIELTKEHYFVPEKRVFEEHNPQSSGKNIY